jgi:nucleotide-binding universal stress UspA family protein
MASAFSRILVPTDFGAESNAALTAAASLARALGASIHLLHVVEEPTLAIGTPDMYGIEAAKLQYDTVLEARSRLAELSSRLVDLHVTSDVWTGRPAVAIARAAADMGAHLIVMGSHGRSAVGRLLIGSVADRVIRLAGCPVMAVREFGPVCVAAGEDTRAA